jgi:hypothetical protein
MKIRIIKRQGKSVLVEWRTADSVKRGFVPSVDVHGMQVSRENLEKAIPHGDNFAALDMQFPDADEFTKMLHEVGVWTKRDMRANMATVRGVVQRVTSALLRQLSDYAKE